MSSINVHFEHLSASSFPGAAIISEPCPIFPEAVFRLVRVGVADAFNFKRGRCEASATSGGVLKNSKLARDLGIEVKPLGR
jgi:hypothetical protein